ncbi:hypothetical protein [Pseudarthrobacter sp. NIBRBAC000502770]|uniref:hypothetical protein n=1 Tax=Pseudarthrobacter sp. NIBRBAC000502770 TaxID=2590785 RepID=UPI001140250D|nr:hypothetical protein [Pseudarthrobacter sp. NIBRBAC000502770]QDG89399.1 hypothetical protein NIBR502770_13595 [Pseudarthrobacter sp. NIBRBAC000502770]
MKTTMKSTLAGLALAAAIGGGALATTALPANAATTDSSTSSSSASATQGQPRDESKGGHQANGITETLLTGDTATKVTDAALAANPGATIQRVENDAEGAVYEAHIIKSDGTRATVYLDASFTVTSTETGGPGGGMKG